MPTFTMVNGMLVMGPSIHKAARAAKGAATKDASRNAQMLWADGASERPYALADMLDHAKSDEAYRYFSGLSLADTKAESAMHGLPITGSRVKLFAALQKHAVKAKLGNPSRGIAPEGVSQAPALNATDTACSKVRKALVADLRKGLVFDKKFKKNKWSETTTNKMLKASCAPLPVATHPVSGGVRQSVTNPTPLHASPWLTPHHAPLADNNCTHELFSQLFPHAAGKKRCALELVHLQIDRLGKDLRYGQSVELIPGTLSASFDGGAIKVAGKYTMTL